MMCGVKIKPPLEGSIGKVPEHLRSPEESYWLEQAEIDAWIEKVEAGDRPASVPITGEWSTVQEVAARHRCSTKTIRARIHDGSLKAVDHSPAGSGSRQARYRIHRDAEVAWLEAKGERRRAAAKAKAGNTFRELVK
jgi:hypothetical protein